MPAFAFFAAIGTPLHDDDSLHAESLEMHLDDQWRGGMTGVLLGGTMGLMQLLREQTYRDLLHVGIRHASSSGQVMVGVGDTSFARTCDRIDLINDFTVDGVVVVSPYLWKFTPTELVAYFMRLADASRNPLFLYDLPLLTGTKLDLDTVLTLAAHPNIHGIKCSADAGWIRQLADEAPPHFRVIFAQADLIDVLLRHGVREHLDGIFSVAPAWVSAIAEAAAAGKWTRAAALQRRLSELLRVFKRYGVFQSMTTVLNARGIPGKFAPAPVAPIEDDARRALLAEAVVQQLLREESLADARETDEPAGIAR